MSRIIELITDAGTGQLSHTKLWTHIAYCAATLAFLRATLFSDTPPDSEIWLIYLGIVGAHNVSSKILSLKYGASK
ncbi:hypothetical protein [Nitrosomonas sp. Nm166]|uniref:hypothetical protein n=1 Tax=Nitrosomonas sp. Nm166 TaxID=1881054 RepID=UPI0008EC2DA2|nr:hypothetical protein [Nitrosomonas sp. Nm166]SFF13703.1 hypothetical protein SAMN05428977_105419 [Nitrosomonas sp. Nm166]